MIKLLVGLLGHFYQKRQYDSLASAARAILKSIPDDIVSLHFLGLAYLHTGRVEDAVGLFSRTGESMRLARQQPYRTPGRRNSSPQLPTAASIFYREAVDLSPTFSTVLYETAMELLELGYREQALVALRNDVSLRPGFSAALVAIEALGPKVANPAGVYTSRGFSVGASSPGYSASTTSYVRQAC